MSDVKVIVNKILEGVSVREALTGVVEYLYIVTFVVDDTYTTSRLLRSTEPLTKQQAENYYAEFCKATGFEFYSLEDTSVNKRITKELIEDGDVDDYSEPVSSGVIAKYVTK